MGDRSLILPGWAVRALLREVEAPGSGKSQHRVALATQPPAGHRLVGIYAPGLTAVFNPAGRDHRGDPDQDVAIPLRFQIKDRIWVRETWAVTTIYDGMKAAEINPEGIPLYCGIRYAATDARLGIKDRSSATMPRWASRLTLIVTDVRVQRVQDISEEDAIAEGVGHAPPGRPAIVQYLGLWDSINGAGSWAANPWVWVVEFRKVKP